MKLLLLGVTSFMALVASGLAARAAPIDFAYTGSVVTFTVPTTDTYQILAFGAQGGNSASFPVTGAGGRGAEIGGDFSLTAGEVLQIAVGGMPMSGSGGGGGSFVIGPANTPLIIAGGGGGGGFNTAGPSPEGGVPGQGGLIGPNGGMTTGGAGVGGTGGNGGAGGCPMGGGGGGGFLSGGIALCGNNGGGAFPDLTGGIGNAGDGGFGGGGGSDFGGGGGGGGYSGGGGGDCGGASGGIVCAPGGGGGSFDAGINQILMADFQTGNGEVVITELAAAVSEPASIALLGAGLLGLAVIRRRRREA